MILPRMEGMELFAFKRIAERYQRIFGKFPRLALHNGLSSWVIDFDSDEEMVEFKLKYSEIWSE